MRTIRLVLLTIALAMPTSLLGAAASGSGATTARLVDSHTIQVDVGVRTIAGGSSPPGVGAPVGIAATLVNSGDGPAFAGGRWFNDQYLIDPIGSPLPPGYHRTLVFAAAVLVTTSDGVTPCVGSVLAVAQGATDPRSWVATATYIESYLVTDPMDREWSIDLWDSGSGEQALSVPILNFQAGAGWTADGSTCSPIRDQSLAADGQGMTYNALMVALGDSLPAAPLVGTVDHASAPASQADGNSHPFNPVPSALQPSSANHGAGGVHEVRGIDLYYGPAPTPPLRNYRLIDTEGSTAPFG